MVNAYKKANKFSDRLTVAQAAVEWHGLLPAQQELIIVKDGIPYLAGFPDLSDRAEAIADAADRRMITGLTHTEDGAPLPISAMSLDKDSVIAWTSKVQSWLSPEPLGQSNAASAEQMPEQEQLLKVNDVLKLLGIGRSTLYRRIDSKEFEKAHFENPSRWRKSYVLSFIMKKTNTEADI